MNKIVYSIDFNQNKTPDGVFCDERTVNKEYEKNEDKGEDISKSRWKTVISIEIVYEYGSRLAVVNYDDGSDDTISNISQIYRKLVLD